MVETSMAPRNAWPKWKFWLVTMALLLMAIVFWVLSAWIFPGVYAELEGRNREGYSLGAMLRLFSLMCGAGFLILIGWVFYRHYRTIPLWKRRHARLPPKRL